jgi:metacaspase-1
MSWAFIQTMRQNPGQSYVQVLQSTRSLLVQNYSQVPQLSVSLVVDSTGGL